MLRDSQPLFFRTTLVFLIYITTFYNSLSTSSCNNPLCNCNGSTCQSCISSMFYLSASQSCLLCDYRCANCNAANSCTVCAINYYGVTVNSNLVCVQCPVYCSVCVGQLCSVCVVNYSLSKTGYALVDNSCQQCEMDNVLSCKTVTTVFSCQQGYWINGNSCLPCRQFCIQCTSSTNCLSCSVGFQIQSSSGTYCTPCATGCNICSGSSCIQCAYNYQLVSGNCVSITLQCSNIPSCQSCQFIGGTVSCIVCRYPYYLNNGNCLIGSSLLCRNGAIGNLPYQCSQTCGRLAYAAYQSDSVLYCLPNVWMLDSDITQLFMNWQSNELQGYTTTTACSETVFELNPLRFTLLLSPYYKLSLFFKLIPLITSPTVSITVTLSDNSSKSYSVITSNSVVICQAIYYNFTSKNIKDQLVSVIVNANSRIGMSELLVQLYRCDSSCRLCYNSEQCIECYGSWFISSNVCVASCLGLIELYLPDGDPLNFTSKMCVLACPPGFYVQAVTKGVSMCIKCQGNCSTCLSKTQCLTCIAPLFYFELLFSCLESCPTTHYSTTVNSISRCALCLAPCLTCLGPSICLSCAMGYFNGNSCVGLCPEGMFANVQTSTCDICSNTCASCLTTSNLCLSCRAGYLLLGSNCIQKCPSNAYFQSNDACVPCVAPCTKCLSATSCLSCSTGFLFGYSCLSTCPDHYYEDTNNGLCSLCQNNCQTCSSLFSCLSCVSGTYLFGSSCLTTCPQRTFQNIKVCTICVQPCLTCIDAIQCLTCAIGFLSVLQPRTCLQTCQNGYYSSLASLKCLPCSFACLTCTNSATNCLSCHPGSFLQYNQCLSTCSVGYFQFNNACSPCSYPCATCSLSPLNCTSCQSLYIYFQSSCISLCPTTYYSTNNSCQPCRYPCRTCQTNYISLTTSAYCLSCVSNSATVYYLDSGACVTKCPENSYGDQSTLACRPCIFPCLTCSGPFSCLSCANGYLNRLKQTCSTCIMGWFADESSKQCSLCNSSIPNCSACLSSTLCTACVLPQIVFNGICISAAACLAFQGYFLKPQSCQACISPCKTCLTSMTCTSCSSGYLLQLNECVFACSWNYFSNTQAICLPCNTNCFTCVLQANHCSSCNTLSSLNVLLVSNWTCIKLSDCIAGYYLDYLQGLTRCIACVTPCLTCTSASKCLSCATGALYRNTCPFVCPIGYYASQVNQIGVCLACDSSCLQCTTTANHCVLCSSPLLLQTTSCVSQCAPNYYLSTSSSQCLICLPPCSSCSSFSRCLSCLNNGILYEGQCLTSCPDGTYFQDNACMSCPAQCQLCEDRNGTVLCLKCAIGLYEVINQSGFCSASCARTEYSDNNTRRCYACITPCVSCSSAIACKSCIAGYLLCSDQCIAGENCPEGYFKYHNSCLSGCPDQLWSDTSSRLCLEQCPNKSLTVVIGDMRECVTKCHANYYIIANYVCALCTNEDCDSLLRITLEPKIIFNTLFLKLQFSQKIDLTKIDPSVITVTALSLSSLNRRVLQQNTRIDFLIAQITAQALWLRLNPKNSLNNDKLQVTFLDYYILSDPILQQLSLSTNSLSFDLYNSSTIEGSSVLQRVSQLLSILMAILFLSNMLINTGFMSYLIIDYYQLLYLVLFLNMDYPPALNYFLYGFRYSHYLFLPQIFSEIQRTYSENAPNRFGVVAENVDFLVNTGHDFLILFVAFGLLLMCKLVQIILKRCLRENKVYNVKSLSQMSDSPAQIKPQQLKTEPISPPSHSTHSSHNPSEISDYINQLESVDGQPTNPKNARLKLVSQWVKAVIDRFKWNYFNDIVYVVYFYLVMFAYSQTYDFSLESFGNGLSIVLAVTFMVLGLAIPIFFFYLLQTNQRRIRQQTYHKQLSVQQKVLPGVDSKVNCKHTSIDGGSQNSEQKPQKEQSNNQQLKQQLKQQQSQQQENFKILTEYKCFVYSFKTKVSFGYYSVPIRYFRKFVISLFLVYTPTYPSFVLGVIIMLTLLNIIVTCWLRPYRLSFQVILYGIFDSLYILIFLSIFLIQLSQAGLSIDQKTALSYIATAASILLSVLLIIHTILINILEAIKYFTGKDYLASYYTSQFITEVTVSSQQDSQMQLKKEQESELDQQGDGSQGSSDGYDLYLRKEMHAPPILIKCVNLKAQQEENKSQQNSRKSAKNVIFWDDAEESITGEEKEEQSQDKQANDQSQAEGQQEKTEIGVANESIDKGLVTVVSQQQNLSKKTIECVPTAIINVAPQNAPSILHILDFQSSKNV